MRGRDRAVLPGFWSGDTPLDFGKCPHQLSDSVWETIDDFDSPVELLRSPFGTAFTKPQPNRNRHGDVSRLPQGKLPGNTIEQKQSRPHKSPRQGSRFLHTLLWLNKRVWRSARPRPRGSSCLLSSAFRSGDTALRFGKCPRRRLDSDWKTIVDFDSPPLLLRSLPSARSLNRSPTATATETFRVCLKANSPVKQLNKSNSEKIKKPPARERFLWFVSLSLNKEMNPAAGPGPGGSSCLRCSVLRSRDTSLNFG